MVVYRRNPPDLEISAVNITTTTNDIVNHEAEKKTLNNSGGNYTHLAPHAVLMCRPNSHPFQERHLVLDQPVKVGRSVARCRPGPTNAIFDCKVLSRNHALLWYEKGTFFLKDTKSSNGTFINNQRLSKGSEESPAREVCSGDIVQFGVDVVENTRKDDSVTHGCIVATLKLFLPDGKEAKAGPTTAVMNAAGSVITPQDLYQLSQFLQEALHREQVLESKLTMLQKVVSTTFEASNSNWKALIDEDRLISRIENLESQLLTASKNISEEKLREEVVKLLEDKDRYQNTAKESLRKILQEKLEIVRKLQDFESSIGNNEEECSRLRTAYETTEKELQILAVKAEEYLKEINALTAKLMDAEEKEELANKANEEKFLLEDELVKLKEQELMFIAKIESLQADRDFANNQLTCLKAHYDQNQDYKLELEKSNDSSDDSDDKRKLDELKTLISEEGEEGKLTLLYKENGKEIVQPSEKDSLRGEAIFFAELKEEKEQLAEILEETREKKNVLETEVAHLKNELDLAQSNFTRADERIQVLERELVQIRQQVEFKERQLLDFQEKNKPAGNLTPFGDMEDSANLASLQQHCNSLQAHLTTLEVEVERYRTENEKLISLYKVAQDSCADLELMKAHLEAKGDNYWKEELSKTKSKLQVVDKELSEAREELFTLKERYAECNERKANLQKELSIANEEMQIIAYQTKATSACSVIPLIVLCLAVLLAICPYLSYFTATSDASETT